jgi:hypothetical protein
LRWQHFHFDDVDFHVVDRASDYFIGPSDDFCGTDYHHNRGDDAVGRLARHNRRSLLREPPRLR